MYSEDDLLPLSGLQHLLYCERQCALIHVEGLWLENRQTAEGRLSHERAHGGGGRSEPGVRTAFSLPLRSLRLGLVGQADVVEFHHAGQGKTWLPFPVEFKRGRPKEKDWDKVQLCAQAMCLEEMLDVGVPAGALFYGQTRRRLDVEFDLALRRATEEAVLRFHDLVRSGRTPKAKYAPELCDACSLLPVCLPKSAGAGRGVAAYLAGALDPITEGAD
jgi:CRISPR-associated exonuclease Cas4